MCHQFYLAFVLGIILALVENGSSLECWKCNSNYDVTCRDHFNVTRLLENKREVNRVDNINNYGGRQEVVRNDPHLEPCDDMNVARHNNYKNVCLKKVVKGQPGMPPKVVRECRMVEGSLKLEGCPEDIARTGNMEYCGTCESDGCNAATVLKTSVLSASIIPVSLMLFLRN